MARAPHITVTSRRGFTLAESLVASVVLALAVVAVSGALIASQQQTAAQQDDAVAATLARALMEEIASTPIVLADGTTGAAGWPAVTNRQNYDTVDDFNGYRDVIFGRHQRERRRLGVENFGSSNAKPDANVVPSGSNVPALTNGEYFRLVSVTFPTSAFGTTVASGDFALVDVTVSGAGGGRVKLSRLITKTTVIR